MTPRNLYDALAAMPADQPLIFQSQTGAIGAGYHVTEWKFGQIRSIDCGGKMDTWSEASLQLLDGRGGTHMAVDKFNAILKQSMERVDGLGDSPMQIEFAHENVGKELFMPSEPVQSEAGVVISLEQDQAACKVVTRMKETGETSGCCGSEPKQSSSSEPKTSCC